MQMTDQPEMAEPSAISLKYFDDSEMPEHEHWLDDQTFDYDNYENSLSNRFKQAWICF